MAKARIPLVASLVAIGAGIVWSFGAIAARKADGVDAFQYLIWRSIGVLITIELLNRWRGQKPGLPRAFRSGRTMQISVVMLLGASLTFVFAVKTTSAAQAAFLSSTTPLITLVAARLILGERLARITVIAVAVGMVGVAIMVSGDLGEGNLVGNIAAFLSSITFAGYAICVRSDRERDWSPTMPGYALMMIVLCTIVSVAQGKPLVPAPSDIAYALLHGSLFIVVGTLMFNWATKSVPAVAMTVFAQAEMVGVPLWACLALNERPDPRVMLGGFVVLLAIVGNAVLQRDDPGTVDNTAFRSRTQRSPQLR
jgi:drug/metabolite transporter, DME family